MNVKSFFILLISIVCCLPLSAKAQTDRQYFIGNLDLRQDGEKLERLIGKFAKRDALLKKDSLHFLHMFILKYDHELKKADFLDSSFIHRLKPIYGDRRTLLKKESYIRDCTVLYDSNGRLRALWGLTIHSLPDYVNTYNLGEQYLIDMFIANEIDYVFKLTPTPFGVYFIGKGDEIKVFMEFEGKTVCTMQEFVDNYWDRYYGSKTSGESDAD